MTNEDTTIVLYTRASIPLNNIPDLYLNNEIKIKSSCSLKDNSMIVMCNLSPYKNQLEKSFNYKVSESCNECSYILDTGFNFNVESEKSDDSNSYSYPYSHSYYHSKLNRLVFYLLIILIL